MNARARAGAFVPSSVCSDLEILLVEDEAIVALMVEELLGRLGCAAVWHASTIAQAMAALDRKRPAVAVLDVNLDGDLVYPLAERLHSLSIPFVFATGYERDAIPERWRDRPCIQKPIEPEALAAALHAALAP